MIQTNVNRASYDGDGVTVDFAFASTVLKDSDVKVIFRVKATGVTTVLTIGAHYSIVGVLDSVGRYLNGVTVRLTFTMSSTNQIIIYQDPDVTQLVDLTDQGFLPVEAQVELPLDRLTLIAQRTRNLYERALRQPEDDSVDVTTLPNSVDRASKYLAFDSDGNPIVAVGTSSTLQPVSAFMDTLLDDANAAAARVTLGLPALQKGSIWAGDNGGNPVETPWNGNDGMILAANGAISNGAFWEYPDQLNPIVNGLGEVWQDGNSFAAIADGAYCADMWRWNKIGAGVVTINRSTNVPSVILNNMLYNYSIEVDVTTADASIAATDFYGLTTFVEGYDWRYFAQRLARLSFCVMSPKTGAHHVAFLNGGGDRYYIAPFTVNVANTWEYKSVSIGASPSGGTWDYTNGLGLQITFMLAAGANFLGPANVWGSGTPLYAVSGQVNCMDNTANFFRLCDVRLSQGSTSFPQRLTPFSQQLARCQRYYQKSFAYGTAPVQNLGSTVGCLSFPSTVGASTGFQGQGVKLGTRMRSTPTITLFNPEAGNAQVRNRNLSTDCSSSASSSVSDDSFVISATTPGSTVAGHQLAVHWSAVNRY